MHEVFCTLSLTLFVLCTQQQPPGPYDNHCTKFIALLRRRHHAFEGHSSTDLMPHVHTLYLLSITVVGHAETGSMHHACKRQRRV